VIVMEGAITTYQMVISPSQGDVCNFSPSCSYFAKSAIAKYGPLWGTLMASDRLMRCNPWAYQHFDTYYSGIVDGKIYDPPENNFIFGKIEKIQAEKFPIDTLTKEVNLKFADYLYAEQDYAGALSEYRRIRFSTGLGDGKISERIIDCRLIQLKRFSEAIRECERIEDTSKKNYKKGRIYFLCQEFDSSRKYLEQIGIPYKEDAKRLLGLGYASEFRFKEAGNYLTLPGEFPSYKKPLLGALFAIFPGGGHLYCGRFGDGLYSLAIVGTSALVSSYYYHQKEKIKYSLCLGSTIIF